ncbi:hypothetical protein BGY98DRAFT_231174 [Russula aff. rugulosa BPL654]|nr:hypothetical protein BGY98DRAFT_231174 [Russula aff. rugulosa BPL654]
MPVDTPFTVYRDELSLSHGLALWNPSHRKRIYDGVSIGDVGYLYEGTFIRMFNVTLPWDDPSNRLFGAPESYDLLYGPLGYTTEHRLPEVFTSRFVTAETNTDDAEVVTYKFRNRGALLSLPNGSHREDIIRAKMFEDHIRDHIEKWFNWSQDTNFGVQRMEDLILVSGRTMAYSWAAAACVDNNPEAEISLTSRTLRDFGTSFVWGNVRGHVSYHNSHFDPAHFQWRINTINASLSGASEQSASSL